MHSVVFLRRGRIGTWAMPAVAFAMHPAIAVAMAQAI
jgi:hypothetical protein